MPDDELLALQRQNADPKAQLGELQRRVEFLERLNAEVKDADRWPDLGPQGRISQRLADSDGYLRGITGIVNYVTGAVVKLPEPIDVHLRDIDRVCDEYQQRFLDEWNAEHPEDEHV